MYNFGFKESCKIISWGISMFIITCNNGSVSSDIIICQFISCDGVLCTTYPFAGCGMLFVTRSYAINVGPRARDRAS